MVVADKISTLRLEMVHRSRWLSGPGNPTLNLILLLHTALTIHPLAALYNQYRRKVALLCHPVYDGGKSSLTAPGKLPLGKRCMRRRAEFSVRKRSSSAHKTISWLLNGMVLDEA
jgi:hypothetical protein